MLQARCFLVVAEDPDRLMLVSATLHRRFPNSVVQTCRDSHAALAVIPTHQLDAIVAERGMDEDEVSLWKQLRAITAVPIVAMSTHPLEAAAKKAGVAKFLPAEQWLLVGIVVAELIGARKE